MSVLLKIIKLQAIQKAPFTDSKTEILKCIIKKDVLLNSTYEHTTLGNGKASVRATLTYHRLSEECHF